MDRLTRHELKQDEFRESFTQLEEFFKKHAQEIATSVGIVVVVLGLAGGLKYYVDRQEAEANADLGAALQTFHAYVGATPEGALAAGESYPTAQDKYKKALAQFAEITQKYKMVPRPKAVGVARYHVGVCQALLGDQAGAIKTLQEASADSDKNVASLAQMALADLFVKSSKLPEAVKIYQNLADHPTVTVPRATALLAMADAYRGTQPAQARQLYQRIEKEFASDPAVSQAISQELTTLKN